MRIGKTEKKRKIVDMDKEPRERIVAPRDDREEVLDAVPIRAEILVAPPAPRRCTEVALDQCARNKDICTPMRRIETLD